MAKTTQIFLVNAYAIPGDLPTQGWADGEMAIVQSTHSLYTWNATTVAWVLLGTAGAGLVNSVTDDGNMVVVVDNSIATDPVITFQGVFVDGTTITGSGQSGDPLVATVTGTSPGGVDTNVQYNLAGVFGGDNNFLWDYTNRIFSVGDLTSSGNSIRLDVNDFNRFIRLQDNAQDSSFTLSTSVIPNNASLRLRGINVFQAQAGTTFGTVIDIGFGDVDLAYNGTLAFLDDANETFTFYFDAAQRMILNPSSTSFFPWGAGSGETYELRFFEILSNGGNYIGYKAPTARTTDDDLILALPEDNPTDGQTILFDTPVSGVSQGYWGSGGGGGIENIDGGFPGDIFSPPLSPLDGGVP